MAVDAAWQRSHGVEAQDQVPGAAALGAKRLCASFHAKSSPHRTKYVVARS